MTRSTVDLGADNQNGLRDKDPWLSSCEATSALCFQIHNFWMITKNIVAPFGRFL